MIDDELWKQLTFRELEVAAELVKGGSTIEMAKRLFIAPKTLRSHIANIMAKTSTNRRSQIAIEYVMREKNNKDKQ